MLANETGVTARGAAVPPFVGQARKPGRRRGEMLWAGRRPKQTRSADNGRPIASLVEDLASAYLPAPQTVDPPQRPRRAGRELVLQRARLGPVVRYPLAQHPRLR